MSEDVIFALSEVEVDTLGLVNQGANREEFFLMKNAEGQVEDGTTENDVATDVTKTVWQRIMGLFQKAAAEVEAAEPEVAEEVETAKLAPEPVDAATSVAETAKVAEVVPEVIVEPLVTNVTKDTVMEDKVMAENEISKADYEAVVKRLELTETELAKAREEKAQQVWLSKTAGYNYLPVAQAELAGKLYSIAKLDEALASWVADVFKAVDNMVADSGLFVEKGHNLPEVDAVTKAMQAADPKAALLGLPKAEAEAYLSAVRARGRM